MNTPFKIRLLLFLLTLSFVATALTLRFTFHEEDILKNDAAIIAENLHRQEAFVHDLIYDPKSFASLKNIEHDPAFSKYVLEDLRRDRWLYVFTFRKHALQFWGANRITPQSDAGLREGSNWVPAQNGYYEAVKRTEGDFSVVVYIPVKARYPIQNTYLINVFTPNLGSLNNLDIAGFNDTNVFDVRSSLDNRFLFSLKLKGALEHNYYSGAELCSWLLAFLLSCILVNSICLWIMAKGHAKLSVLLICLFFLATRAVALSQHWLIANFDLPVFDPKQYSSGKIYPTFGDLLLNVFACCWCIIFIYRARNKITLTELSSNWARMAVFLLLCIGFGLLALHVDNTLEGLVINSSIPFDVTNVLSLTWFSGLGILVMCAGALNLYLLLIVLLVLIRRLDLAKYDLLLLYVFLAACLIFRLITQDFTIYCVLFVIIIYINAWQVLKGGYEFNAGIFALSLILFTGIASFKLSEHLATKDQESRKVLAQNLEMSDDPTAVIYFDSLEQKIISDQVVINYFKGKTRDYSHLKTTLQKFYFDGYLTRYELSLHEYTPDGNSLEGNQADNIGQFKELVVAGTLKVSDYFYRVNNTFGTRHFFAILPIRENGSELGTLVVELTSETFESPDAFPRVLADTKIEETDDIHDYSFAFYKDGNLVNQYGSYAYKLGIQDYQASKSVFSFLLKDNYDHLVYRANPRNIIVVSGSVPGMITQFGSVSFLFLVLLIFSGIVAALNWIWSNLVVYRPGALSRWEYLVGGGHILYKTRIQASIVAAVIMTLIIVGVVTYFNIVKQYSQQQEQSVTERLAKIASAFEDQVFKADEPFLNEQIFNGFADVNTTDLTYFSNDGKLIYSTQPKIYDIALVSSMMNATAYVNLHDFKRSEFLNERESVGRMIYIAAYRPIRNSAHKTIGYLSLPYFSKQHDFELRIGEFLNNMVNVYALVLVAIGFFAVFIANQITYPLTLIQKSLSQIKIGAINKPISWKRNDEIGSLIREYNTMINELEESAMRLARSERETAWKEMAKQVAHEIKNPLTPLKLGVQLLDKSWREKDPNFNKKFERFSKSFIEQIESLAHIASEFSNFAKMPETMLEEVNLRDLIEQSIEVYSKLSNVSILLESKSGEEKPVRGDKDQLLRCFNNLIKNATEAIPETRAGMIRVSIGQSVGIATIEIRDNGKGIPDGLKEWIFNPNFTTKTSGTGLGLAFVKQAIENMSGTISFITEHDQGTTFIITFPVTA